MVFRFLKKRFSKVKKRLSGSDFDELQDDNKSLLEFSEDNYSPPVSRKAWVAQEDEVAQDDSEKRNNLSDEFFNELNKSNPDLMAFLEPAIITVAPDAEESEEVLVKEIPSRVDRENSSSKSTAEHRKSIIYDKDALLESARNQSDIAKDSKNPDLIARKVAYNLAIIQAEQAFALGNKDAAEFLMFANFGLTDGVKKIIEWDAAALLKWKFVNDVIKDFANRSQDYMDDLVKDYGSVESDENAQKLFVTKYVQDMQSANPNSDDEMLENALSNALICYISSEIKSEHNLSEWMHYLKGADTHLEMQHIVNEYLVAHNVDPIGVSPEA